MVVVVAAVLVTMLLGARDGAATEIRRQRRQTSTGRLDHHVAFWNVRISSTDDDATNKGDDEFCRPPIGPGGMAQLNIRGVIVAFAPHALGVAEIENRRVLKICRDTGAQTARLQDRARDSPDKRNIDVALIYRANRYVATSQCRPASRRDRLAHAWRARGATRRGRATDDPRQPLAVAHERRKKRAARGGGARVSRGSRSTVTREGPDSDVTPT